MVIIKAWDEIWKTKEGRALWLEPDPFVASLLPRFKKEGIEKILDIGFGVGRHAIFFAKEGFDAYGIEPSPTAIKYAIKWAEQEEVTLKLRTAEMNSLPFDTDLFDLVLAWNVIYHGTISYIRQTFKEIKRCLKFNGYLLCTLISTRHNKYGLGEEIEENTFIIAEEQEKSHPHHYFDIDEINQYLGEFILIKCEDREQFYPGSFHWYILARFVSK
ncbi:MAG: class I SAM-dependent methyltransferase [Promethearchaeota archaeon]